MAQIDTLDEQILAEPLDDAVIRPARGEGSTAIERRSLASMLERARESTQGVVSQLDETRRRRTGPLILELDLTEPLLEATPHDPLNAVMARRRTLLRTVVETLRHASRDDRVRALVVRLGGVRSPLGLAQAQELRDAVRDFRRGGKLAVAWAETFGEGGRGTAPYYLAAAFDEIWLQPSGDVFVTGVAVQAPFLRDALDKAGITFELGTRHEYKNAANMFTERGFTDAHREATERIVFSALEQVVTGIAEDRGLDASVVAAVVDRAPLFAPEALDAGLIDRLGYRDEVYDHVRGRVGEPAELQYVARYARAHARASLPQRMRVRPPTIAVVHVDGVIHLGKSGRQPMTAGGAGADTVIAGLRAATKAADVKAIVLRVTSPGGSYVASDAIWREVGLARRAGKPVVVSMGDVAASGGYFVSMGADAIVAEPATITGSIGVVVGKPVADRLADRIGIGHEHVTGGDHALMFSPLRGFSGDEWARLDAWLDRIYDDFVGKVAAGRGLPAERVHEIARGRVWTGADAAERGLVDALGGLAAAVEVAKERAGLAVSDEPELRVHPRRPLVARLTPAESSEHPAAARARVRDAWGGFADLALALGLPAHGPLTLLGDWRLR